MHQPIPMYHVETPRPFISPPLPYMVMLCYSAFHTETKMETRLIKLLVTRSVSLQCTFISYKIALSTFFIKICFLSCSM